MWFLPRLTIPLVIPHSSKKGLDRNEWVRFLSNRQKTSFLSHLTFWGLLTHQDFFSKITLRHFTYLLTFQNSKKKNKKIKKKKQTNKLMNHFWDEQSPILSAHLLVRLSKKLPYNESLTGFSDRVLYFVFTIKSPQIYSHNTAFLELSFKIPSIQINQYSST